MTEAQRLHDAIGHLSDQLTEVQADLKASVAEGLREVMTDPEVVGLFWRAALSEIQNHAQRQAGGLMFTGLKKLATIAMLVMLAYSVGGSALASKAWHWVTSP